MIMRDPDNSFFLLWAGMVCEATSRFLKWQNAAAAEEVNRKWKEGETG